jgi:hypothetical protein
MSRFSCWVTGPMRLATRCSRLKGFHRRTGPTPF